MINEEFQLLIDSGYEFSSKIKELLNNGYCFSNEQKELLINFSKRIKYTAKGKCICLCYTHKLWFGGSIGYTFLKDKVYTYYKRPNSDGEITIIIEDNWPNRNQVSGEEFKSNFIDLAKLREQRINSVLYEI
jgi:hypothetical protein